MQELDFITFIAGTAWLVPLLRAALANTDEEK